MRRRGNPRGVLLTTALSLLSAAQAWAAKPPPADLVITDARIYTADATHSEVQALAVRSGKIVFRGTRMNAAGITGIMDAAAGPDSLPLYDALEHDNDLTLRVTLAQLYDPDENRTTDGRVDYDRMVASAKRIRAKYAKDPLIRADFIKLFADGVLEGNPYAVPPTSPETLSLHP